YPYPLPPAYQPLPLMLDAHKVAPLVVAPPPITFVPVGQSARATDTPSLGSVVCGPVTTCTFDGSKPPFRPFVPLIPFTPAGPIGPAGPAGPICPVAPAWPRSLAIAKFEMST